MWNKRHRNSGIKWCRHMRTSYLREHCLYIRFSVNHSGVYFKIIDFTLKFVHIWKREKLVLPFNRRLLWSKLHILECVRLPWINIRMLIWNIVDEEFHFEMQSVLIAIANVLPLASSALGSLTSDFCSESAFYWEKWKTFYSQWRTVHCEKKICC